MIRFVMPGPSISLTLVYCYSDLPTQVVERLLSSCLPLLHPFGVNFQLLVLFENRRFCELGPDQRHRLIVTFAAVILLGQELAQPRVGVFGKALDATLRPFQRKVVFTGALVGLGDLEIMIG